jgi:hypothetical protein
MIILLKLFNLLNINYIQTKQYSNDDKSVHESV